MKWMRWLLLHHFKSVPCADSLLCPFRFPVMRVLLLLLLLDGDSIFTDFLGSGHREGRS